VKLNGETAATKPSMPLYRMEFLVIEASSLMGWYFSSSLAKKALNLSKEIRIMKLKVD
jgi:hypothetical protein